MVSRVEGEYEATLRMSAHMDKSLRQAIIGCPPLVACLYKIFHEIFYAFTIKYKILSSTQ